MSIRRAMAGVVALSWAGLALPAASQGWAMVENDGAGGAGAFVCSTTDEGQSGPPCFRVACIGDAPLRFEVTLDSADADGLAEEIAAEVRVDGRAVGLLLLAPEIAQGAATFEAPFDPRLHRDLVEELRRGTQAELALPGPDGAVVTALSLRGSAKTLGAVMDACPMPELPLNDPAALVLDEIVRECGKLDGSVAMEPGFERREDLDGDGRDDVVIDYAAAVCSELRSLYCGSGGCTTGFFLQRDNGFRRIYTGVIRNYSARPGGLLALDLHGSACGLVGADACRKVFRIDDDSFALVEELAGEAAEAARAADQVGPVAIENDVAAPGEAEAEAGVEPVPDPSLADETDES